jgi:hypothetical protein
MVVWTPVPAAVCLSARGFSTSALFCWPKPGRREGRGVARKSAGSREWGCGNWLWEGRWTGGGTDQDVDLEWDLLDNHAIYKFLHGHFPVHVHHLLAQGELTAAQS